MTGLRPLPNEGSIALHERLGFRKAAHFSEVGMEFRRWIDVGYWELRLSKYEHGARSPLPYSSPITSFSCCSRS